MLLSIHTIEGNGGGGGCNTPTLLAGKVGVDGGK